MVAGPAPRDPTAAQGEREHAMPASGYGMYGSSSGDHPPPPGLVASSGGETSGYGSSEGYGAPYGGYGFYDGDIGHGGLDGLGGMGDVAPGMASAKSVRSSGMTLEESLEDMPTRADRGLGPGLGGDRYATIDENPFIPVKNEPLSTFSIDVDTASYSKVRQYLLQHNTLPRPDAVRIEELINYFRYEYEPPAGDDPFAAHIEVAECLWTPAHRLVRVGIKGREIERDSRPTSNLVFLLDVSGSMNQPNKLPLMKRGMKMLVDQLGENDRVAIVVYAGAAGMVLDSTTGDQKPVVMNALDRLQAGGSTNGGQGIRLAYQAALDHFVQGGVNRVILCTDGDFNVGVTGTDELVRLVEENAKRGVFLTVLGFGMGNHNDAMLEELSNKGNGNYAFIDTDAEARKVLVEQLSGTLVTIAKDVKIQVEFNPAQVSAYRLIGYENRLLAAQDFNDDRKDAGEIGAGHTVTALYEIVPADAAGQLTTPPVDELRYQQHGDLTGEAKSGELLTLKIRYKQPDGDTSTKLTFPVADQGYRFGQASKDFRFAAAVASFGMLLRNSQYRGNATYAGVLETAQEAAEGDTTGYRQEFLTLVRAAMAQGERRP
jgi:Ca-activated chloride channel homolog